MKKGHALLLAAAITDSTFERGELDGKRVWIGKCLHCNTRLVVGDDGRSQGAATLEHVFPQTQGGTDDLVNIAVACGRCNREKGSRHDHRGGERFEEVVAKLRARRAERWRDPDAVGQAERLAGLLAED